MTPRPTLKKLGLTVAGLCLVLVAAGAPADAATGTQTFRIVFTADPHTGAPGTVIATGLVNGIGTDRTIAQDPHPDGSETDTDLITLPGGTITIADTDPSDLVHFNPAACLAALSGTGTYTILGGTGAYAGASGRGTFTVQGVIVFNRAPGGCSEAPRLFFAAVTVVGPISVS